MTQVQADEEAIRAFRDALLVFANRQGQALEWAEREISHTQRALDEAEEYWRRELDQRNAALRQCLIAAVYAADEGRSMDCSYYRYAVQEAEAHIVRILEAKRRVYEAVGLFHTSAQRYVATLDGEVPRARAFLENRFEALEAYLAAQASGTAEAASSVQAGSTQQPSRLIWESPRHAEAKDGAGASPERRG